MVNIAKIIENLLDIYYYTSSRPLFYDKILELKMKDKKNVKLGQKTNN